MTHPYGYPDCVARWHATMEDVSSRSWDTRMDGKWLIINGDGGGRGEGKVSSTHDWPAIISFIREANGWSMLAMEKKLGTYKSSVGRWQSGDNVPHPDVRLRILEMAAKTKEGK